MSSTKTIWLARHGEALGQGLFLGMANVSLSPLGVAQSRRLAESLAGAGIDVVWSSPLARARETADILAWALDLAVRLDERLQEIGYGEWDGLGWEEIERRAPETAALKLSDWWGVTPPGGEPPGEFAARIEAVWRDLARDSARRVLVVGHLGVNALLAEIAASGEPNLARITAFEQAHGTAVKIEASH